MTVYQYSGAPLILTDSGGGASGNLLAGDCFNPLTGAQGPTFIKVTNSSPGNIATVTSTFETETYTFTNLSGTSSGSGANATFDVTVTNSGYTAVVVDAGDGFIATETVTILGSLVGGVDTTNDVTITVDSVDSGAIETISVAGTQVWPQGTQPTLTVGPGESEFIQINTGVAVDTFFTMTMDDSANVAIAPVQIVG